EAKLAALAQRRDQLVRDIGNLVARELHVVACIAARSADNLPLGDEGILDAPEHLLIADTLLAHIVAILAEYIAHLVIEPVLYFQLVRDEVRSLLGKSLGVK